VTLLVLGRRHVVGDGLKERVSRPTSRRDRATPSPRGAGVEDRERDLVLVGVEVEEEISTSETTSATRASDGRPY